MIGLYYLILITFYVLVGYFAIRRLARIPEKKWLKVLVFSAAFIVWILIPTYDEILGRIYFSHLCETEAGVKVYQTIELPAEYWDENGNPKFYKGAMNNDVPVYAFERLGIPYEIRSTDRHRIFHIDQYGSVMTSQKTHQLLNEVNGFRYWGGWLKRYLSPHNSATSCQKVAETYDELILKQFSPSEAKD